MSTKETLLEINGLTIKTESIYKVINKPDSNAPSGFIKEGTTKLPSVGVGNTVPCRFNVQNKSKGTGVYDTGLYEESPCYSTKDRAEVKMIVDKLRKHIIEPYERKYGRGILDHNNIEFWDSFGVDLFDGRFFVTSNVDDLLGLYIAMLGFELTPKEKLGDPKFRESEYSIEDKEKVQSIRDERANNLMDTYTNFGILLKNDDKTLFNILKYVQLVGVTDKIDPKTLKSLFFEWLNKSEENVKRFDAAFKLSQDSEKSEILDLYVIAYKLSKKGVLKLQNGQYNYEGKALGADLKTVAQNLIRKDFEELKIKLIEIE